MTADRLIPASLLGFVLLAAAQEPEVAGSDGTAPACGAADAGPETCEPRGAPGAPSQREAALAPEPPGETAQCSADVDIEYEQAGSFADVEGLIEVEGCAAAVGGYTITARVRNEQGEIERLEFSETWERDDDGTVSVEGRYPIGFGVELLNVRARGVRCDCVTEADE